MRENPLISVIVPIYKVEDYLKRCIDSIINQTYKNLEVILVDDGSPDNCPQICDDYAKQDTRIKVIHKENGGLSDARNAGMQIATGEYISFIDSDDYVDVDMLNILLDVMVQNDCEIAQCGTVRFNDGEIAISNKVDYKVKVYNNKEALKELINDGHFVQTVWNKLYKAEVALKLPFRKGKLNEDEFWTYIVFAESKKIAEVTADIYFYLQRSTSIMGENYSIRRLDALEAKAERQEYLQEKFPELADDASKNLFFSCVYSYQRVLRDMPENDRTEAKTRILNVVRQYPITNTEILNSKESIWYKISKVSFELLCRTRNLMKIGL